MLCLSIVLILAYLPFPSASFERAPKHFKCFACIGNANGLKQDCSRKSRFVTCKYSSELINWKKVSRVKRKRTEFGCIILVYEDERGRVVKRGCVGLIESNYKSLCDDLALAHNFTTDKFLVCHICDKEKCNGVASSSVENGFAVSTRVLAVIVTVIVIIS